MTMFARKAKTQDHAQEHAQDHAQGDDSSQDSMANDLKILGEMNIDEDFNAWGDFRASVAIKGRRESLESLVTQSSKRGSNAGRSIGNSGRSRTSTTPVVLGVQNKFEASEMSILECDLEESKHSQLTHSEHGHGSEPLDVSFSSLTPGERRDIRAWNTRMARDTVFSRYYFPQQWELKELKTLEKFLEVEDPNECPWYLNEIGLETTKKTVTDIFFPGDHDAKSVLLKRGPILLDATNEREILLFTHGFLLHRLEFDTLLNIIFTVNSENPEFLTSKQLEDRFNAIDTDQSGNLDRCELKEVFKGMGVPISELALSDIMDRFDVDNDGTIDFDEFEQVMQSLLPKKEEKWGWGMLGGIKRSMMGSPQAERKIECAYPLSDIKKVESVNVCSSAPTEVFVNSSWADQIFAIYVRGKDEPYLMVCSKPEQREAWVDAFRTCIVKSILLRASNGSKVAKKVRAQIGWQHIMVQSSLFSLVCCNDLAGLELYLDNHSYCSNIDEQDEYLGYTALHYAATLGYKNGAELLLQHDAMVNVEDEEGKTPLDLAIDSESKDLIKLLGKYGAKKQKSDVLFKSAVLEQEQLRKERPQKSAAKKTADMAKGATGAMHQAMSAMRERGEKLEKLDNKTSELQIGASNYAEMAKQMNAKNKKKAAFWGVKK